MKQIFYLPQVKHVNSKFPVDPSDLSFHYANFAPARARFLLRKFEYFVGYRRSVNVFVKCVAENFKETLVD